MNKIEKIIKCLETERDINNMRAVQSQALSKEFQIKIKYIEATDYCLDELKKKGQIIDKTILNIEARLLVENEKLLKIASLSKDFLLKKQYIEGINDVLAKIYEKFPEYKRD